MAAAISDPYLFQVRSETNLTEARVYVCLGNSVSDDPNPMWYELGKKPDSETLSSGYWLFRVPMPDASFPATKAMASHGATIFMIGSNEDEVLNLRRLNCATKAWDDTAFLNLHRRFIDGIRLYGGLQDGIFLLGGQGLYPEVYHPQTQTWSLLPDPEVRSEATVIAVGSTDQQRLEFWAYDVGICLKYSLNLTSQAWETEISGLRPSMWEGNYCKTLLVGDIIVRFYGKRLTFYNEVTETMMNVEGLSTFPKKPIFLLDFFGTLLVFWRTGDELWCCDVKLEKRQNNTLVGSEIWRDVVLRLKNTKTRGDLEFLGGACIKL
ncbi:unnamed protein product [Arabidopsis arenosa]|uniref:FKB95-like N-terminal Kelch domain-containing protein n=1 Tax=Arabidopsis arenosa TaxID=38785 RepID=A0A8S2A3J7_ARAAE|nr:unnamed protein product [Arabidopsis arenosa]